MSDLAQSKEERPRVCSRQLNRDNTPAESVSEYWKRTVAIPFLDTVCSELKSRFSQETVAHYELCALIPSVITTKSSDEIADLDDVLRRKWNHLLPLPSSFESELFRWKNYCKERDVKETSATSLLAKYADSIFFPNTRELLKILAVLPIGSTEAERSFSCVRRIHTWLRSTMTTQRLSDLACIAMHNNFIHISRDAVCQRYIAAHPRRIMSPSLLNDD